MSINATQIAFIGAGNMAEALIKGLLNARMTTARMLVAADANAARLQWVVDEYGIAAAGSNSEAVARAGLVVLAVKPQMLLDVAREIAPAAHSNQTFVSIAAGMPLQRIEAVLPQRAVVIRAMPNTPALVQRGVTALARGLCARDTDVHLARDLFLAAGKVIEVKEELMNIVTALSGSGPAYVFYVMEAMIEAGVAHGLSDADARMLVEETIRGAGELAARLHDDPQHLRRRVTSPGGTTEAAIAVLDRQAVKQAMAEAISAAVARGRELGA